MNQILYTGGKNKKGKMTHIQKTIMFFVIFIMAFGICAIAIGTNLLSKVKNENNVGNLNTTPNTPAESNIDVEFKPEVGAVKVIITSEHIIESVKYWWDEEEPTVVEVNEKQYEGSITSKQGTHTLTMEITDEKGYTKTLTQRVIGDVGPEVTITTDRISNYVVKVKDDEEVTKVVIILNGETQEIEVNSKEFEHKIAIPRGNSTIEVTAYNLNELTTTKKAKIENFGG